MGLYNYTMNYIQKPQLPRERNFKFRLRFLCTLCMRSGGTDGMSRHQYQSQLNTIACHSQAALHSLVMSGWHCWSHMAAGVWEFNHRAAIKFSLYYGCPPLWLNAHLPPGLGEAGGGRRAPTWSTGQQTAAPPSSLGDTSCPWVCAIGHSSSPQTYIFTSLAHGVLKCWTIYLLESKCLENPFQKSETWWILQELKSKDQCSWTRSSEVSS